jgi:hypothetical protein
MRNRASHHKKFLREWQVLKARYEQGEAEEVWCTREDAKTVIDDLTEEEFAVLTAVLGHLFGLNERFPKASEVRGLEGAYGISHWQDDHGCRLDWGSQ